MGTKKKYPEPFKRSDSKVYYFMYEGKDGKRRRMTTGTAVKEGAKDFIRKFIDERHSEATLMTFAESL
jgi:hypothetical protein